MTAPAMREVAGHRTGARSRSTRPVAVARSALGLAGRGIAALAVTGCIPGAPTYGDDGGGVRAAGGRGDLLSTVGGAGGREGRAGGGSGNAGGQSRGGSSGSH